MVKGPTSMVPLEKSKKEEMEEDESGSEENEDLDQEGIEPGDSEEDGDDVSEEDDEETDTAKAGKAPSAKGAKFLDNEAIEENLPIDDDDDDDEDEDDDDDDEDDDDDDINQDARLLMWDLPKDIKQSEIEALLKQSKLDIEEIHMSTAPCAIVKLKSGVTGDYGDLPEKKLRGQPLRLAIFLGEMDSATEDGKETQKEAKASQQQPKASKQPSAAKTVPPPRKDKAEDDDDEEDEEEADEEDEDEEEEGAPSPVSTKKSAPASKTPTGTRPAPAAGGKLTVVVTSIPFDTSMEDVKAYLQKHSPTNVFMPTRPDGKHKGLAKLDFPTAEAAEAALSVLNGVEFNGRSLRAKMDDNLVVGGAGGDRQQQRGNWQNQRQDSPGNGRPQDPERGQTRCLLVKGLPMDVKNDSVTQMFGGSGKVERVYTLTGGASKHGNAAAFVTFTSNDEAATAFDEYNGKQMEDCPIPLQIGFAREKGKDDRDGGFRGGRGGGGFRGGFRGGDRGGFGGGFGGGFRGGRGRGGFDRGGRGGGGRGGGRGFRGGGGGRGFGGGRGGFKRQSGDFDMSGSPNQKHVRFNGGEDFE